MLLFGLEHAFVLFSFFKHAKRVSPNKFPVLALLSSYHQQLSSASTEDCIIYLDAWTHILSLQTHVCMQYLPLVVSFSFSSSKQ